MPFTQVDLIARVLGQLGVDQPGQDPSPEDAAIVSTFVTAKLAELSRRRILYVGNADEIDEEVFLPLVKLIANAAAPDFAMPFDEAVDDREERRLRQVNRGPATYPTMRGDYF